LTGPHGKKVRDTFWSLEMNLTDVYEELTGPLSIGTLIHGYRTTNNLTAAQLERKLGLPRGVISKLERGQKHCSLKEALNYAKRLKDDQDFYAEVWLRSQLREVGLDPSRFLRSVE
jgi:transcriptional regulator with XRE-family HTH domain